MTPRHAVVTGAAGGIGQAIVQAFNEAGYAVIATDVVPQPAGLACALYLEVDLARTVQDEAYAAGERYLPDDMPEPFWYQPVPRGLESKIADKLAHLRALDEAAAPPAPKPAK